MPFKSKDQFFYLLYNEPVVFADWVETYGVPEDFKVGSTEHWKRAINKLDPKRNLTKIKKQIRGAEEVSNGLNSQMTSNKIKQIINSITLEDLQKRYYEFLKEINKQENKEGDFNISDNEGSYYPILLKNYLKQKGITEKSTIINCPSCLKKGYGKNKLEYSFLEELEDYGEQGELEWTIQKYFKKSPKNIYWNYCYDCEKDIKIPKDQIREMYGEEVWAYLSKIVDDVSILNENFDESIQKQFKIYKKDINPAKKKLIKGIETEGDKVKIYRALTAKRDWLDRPTKKNSIMDRGLGIFWSFDKNQAKNYFYEKQKAKYVRDYRIYALADLDEIDWALTILLNSSDWQKENEIRIIKGSPLDILEIDGQDRWYKPLDISMLPKKEIKATEEFSAYNPPQAGVGQMKRGCYPCPDCRRSMSPTHAKGFGVYCHCWHCGANYITKPLGAEEKDMQGNSLKAKVDALRGGVDAFTYDKEQLNESDLMRPFLAGVIRAFQTSIKGIDVAGIEKTIEELTVKFIPNAEMKAELMSQEGFEKEEHYWMGEIWGYDEVINFLSPYDSSFQREYASEIKKIYEEDTNLTRKEIKTIMWYPLVVGFMGGTLATVVGNIISAIYLKRKHGLWASEE